MINRGENESIVFHECPVGYLPDWTQDIINLFYLCYAAVPSQGGLTTFHLSALPSHGGVLDQDNATMECFSAIRAEFADINIEQAKKQKAKADAERGKR